jgi:hypothetical protein
MRCRKPSLQATPCISMAYLTVRGVCVPWNRRCRMRRIALCVCCDIAEHCGEAANPLAQQFLPVMLAFSDPAQISEVRQVSEHTSNSQPTLARTLCFVGQWCHWE